MRKLLPYVGLLALSAGPACASGINLGWNDCPSGAAYSLAKTFACDTNTGTHMIVGSFVAPAGVQMMSENEFVIDLQTGPGSTLPEWWKMRTGYCRAGSLGYSFEFGGGPFTCYDYWRGGGMGAVAEDPPGSINRARIKGQVALLAGDPRITSVAEGTEVYSFKCNINSAKSTGSGACDGCGEEACIVLQYIRLGQPLPLPSITLSNTAAVHHVVWQGWSNPDPQQQCPAVTPVRRRTWGSIKALYR